MSHLQYTAKSHHLQWDMKQLSKICHQFYRDYCLVLQAELGMKSQRHFYRICRLFSYGRLLERSRFNRRSRQLIWLVQLIRQAMNKQLPPDTIVIMDSFPLTLCQSIRNHRARIFEGLADIGYNASKRLWFYGFKVHMLVTLSGYILNYVVTPASVHDIKVVDDLLEGCRQSVILADLGYLSQELKDNLERRGDHLWTPWRQNMEGAGQHNNWRLLAMRRTIETRFSKLCTLFDMEQTFARGLTGLQLRLEQILLAYNLSYFEFN